LPAVALSIYYICIWDPGYVTKFPPDRRNLSDSYELPREELDHQQWQNGGAWRNSDTQKPSSRSVQRQFLHSDLNSVLNKNALLTNG
uniref:Secreted protein n=1 Tax=Anisakis simplex TaxID=6269 RepID=A0A0M3J5Q1_ANISI